MCSHLLREPGVALVLVIAFAATAVAGDEDVNRAKAALALAKAKRERESVKMHALACHADYATAAKEAETTGKPLCVWVGVKCTDQPELRKALSGAVHVHQAEWRKDATPCVIIQGGDGIEYWVSPEKIKPDTAAKIKAKWELPYLPPIRGDVRISETLSYGPVYYAPMSFAASGNC